jgi:hypothetical protein
VFVRRHRCRTNVPFMASEGIAQQVVPPCPRCGGNEVRTVGEAWSGQGSTKKNLADRLARGPKVSHEGCSHFIEGVILSLLAGAGLAFLLAWLGIENQSVVFTIAAIVAVLGIVLTIKVIRKGNREMKDLEAGHALADLLWSPAHYCYTCEGVFCPGGAPWRGVLTPEQFKLLVWRQGGYEEQLGGKERNTEIPPGTLIGG